MGNSALIASEHYLMVTPEDWKRASTEATPGKVARKVTQQVTQSDCTECEQSEETRQETHSIAEGCKLSKEVTGSFVPERRVPSVRTLGRRQGRSECENGRRNDPDHFRAWCDHHLFLLFPAVTEMTRVRCRWRLPVSRAESKLIHTGSNPQVQTSKMLRKQELPALDKNLQDLRRGSLAPVSINSPLTTRAAAIDLSGCGAEPVVTAAGSYALFDEGWGCTSTPVCRRCAPRALFCLLLSRPNR